jgi:hypothetical protein
VIDTSYKRQMAMLTEMVNPDGSIGVTDRSSLIGQYVWEINVSHYGNFDVNLYVDGAKPFVMYVDTAKTLSLCAERSREVTLYIV